MKLSNKGVDKLYNSYDTMDLLYAVDALDQVRYLLADDDKTLRPPEIRQRLMRLHQLASQLLNEFGQLSDKESEELLNLREEIESEVFEMQSHLDKIYDALRPLEDLYPNEDEYWEEEE